MLPEDLLQLDQISLSNTASSKKRVLEVVADLLAAGTNAPPAEAIYEKLLDRERLGSTGMNHGIALPHARIKGINKPTGAFLQLNEGIDFDALDNKPVDLIFGLLVPEQATEAHLELLAELAKLFNNPQLCTQVRHATSPEQVSHLLCPPPLPDAASDHS